MHLPQGQQRAEGGNLSGGITAVAVGFYKRRPEQPDFVIIQQRIFADAEIIGKVTGRIQLFFLSFHATFPLDYGVTP